MRINSAEYSIPKEQRLSDSLRFSLLTGKVKSEVDYPSFSIACKVVALNPQGKMDYWSRFLVWSGFYIKLDLEKNELSTSNPSTSEVDTNTPSTSKSIQNKQVVLLKVSSLVKRLGLTKQEVQRISTGTSQEFMKEYVLGKNLDQATKITKDTIGLIPSALYSIKKMKPISRQEIIQQNEQLKEEILKLANKSDSIQFKESVKEITKYDFEDAINTLEKSLGSNNESVQGLKKEIEKGCWISKESVIEVTQFALENFSNQKEGSFVFQPLVVNSEKGTEKSDQGAGVFLATFKNHQLEVRHLNTIGSGASAQVLQQTQDADAKVIKIAHSIISMEKFDRLEYGSLEGHEKKNDEYEIMKKIHQENIISILALGEAFYSPKGGFLGFEQERIKQNGESLIKGSEPILYQQILKLSDDLEKLHAKGISHGDIKPANIAETKEGKLVYIDFGAAVDMNAINKNSSRSDIHRLCECGSSGYVLKSHKENLDEIPGKYQNLESVDDKINLIENAKEIRRKMDYFALGITLYQVYNKTLFLPYKEDDEDQKIYLDFSKPTGEFDQEIQEKIKGLFEKAGATVM